MLNKNKQINAYSSARQGFSIMEVVVAIGIFSIALIGISSLMLQNLQVEELNSDYLTASMLAQEGIEIVRNYRDHNWLNPANPAWNEFIGTSFSLTLPTDGTFIVDHSTDYDTVMNSLVIDDGPDSFSDSDTVLQVDPLGFYNHGIGDNTRFRRLITVDDTSAPCDTSPCMRVTATVQWTSRGRTSEYLAETFLYDWR